MSAQARYAEERSKRLRDDGVEQFIDISISERFQHFQNDPWVEKSSIKDAKEMFPNNSCEMLILGAGWGGLLYAVRMIEAGIKPENIRIVDTAGGFGGTWYYNRYPGLSCDIESYLYLPLLEETGYIPKHRYSYGQEIRNYANLVAERYGISDSAVFLTTAERLEWNETSKEWHAKLTQRKGDPQTLNVRAKFVAMVNGVLSWPKLPGIPGILDYQGSLFHSSRWDYSVTGGSQEEPVLDKLQDKRVAVIGTGASAVQLASHVARWAEHLYIVQRTPAAVDIRDQRQTDPEWFKKEVATSKGWQRERSRNFHQHFTTAELPTVNLVGDQWTHAQGMVPIAGNPDPNGPKTPGDLPTYMEMLNILDLPRQTRIRSRVDQIVSDHTVAEKLKPWYPTWCKRPCFHNEYLETFNRKNVTLIDTGGKGIDSITRDSITVGSQSYPVDIVIFATGFRPPYGGTPAEKANLKIIGRNGLSMTQEWENNGPSTLHGVLDCNFPNLFLSGPWQASTSGNFLFNDDALATHSAYILKEAKRRADGRHFTVVSTPAAVEDWGMQVLMRSAPMAAIIGCTPSYFNLEGAIDRTPPQDQMKMARSGLWGTGIEDFLKYIEAWRKEGNMMGIEVLV
ncbi:FAD-binding monooxygenase ausC [Lachnellula suecica]|uniref:FAD-binding monooxygenase ausC n=1 Tax=Lachnellula suecica TaxID=602035 RepID=A0A8T9CB26_9HELO|nr:FAD-binding monooxygenase ausC [Lachnellula suecica]